jgi:uncharacterized membrane protein
VASAISLQPWQWGVVALAYAVAFAAPAAWMWRRAKRDGDNAFVWTVLVLVGSVLGIVEYYEHRAILKRRAERAQRKR